MDPCPGSQAYDCPTRPAPEPAGRWMRWATVRTLTPLGGLVRGPGTVLRGMLAWGHAARPRPSRSWRTHPANATSGIRLAAALRRSAAKMDGRTWETTNAPVSGQGSVAEESGDGAPVP